MFGRHSAGADVRDVNGTGGVQTRQCSSGHSLGMKTAEEGTQRQREGRGIYKGTIRHAEGGSEARAEAGGAVHVGVRRQDALPGRIRVNWISHLQHRNSQVTSGAR
jgi:hypothetical protein